jgi:protein-L-isoaspartate O-methyltransferase
MGPSPWQIASPDMVSMAFMGLAGPAYVTTDNPKDLYHNVLVALDPDRHLNNGQPSALARWIDALALEAGDRVYHLGCAVGYYTAIMAEVVGPDGQVAASEVYPKLAARARDNLSSYTNVSVHMGDGAEFDPGECDAIFINAGVTHPHPLWLELLSHHGRLVLPLSRYVFPRIPGVNLPHEADPGMRLDFGPRWREGILSLQPPKVGPDFPVLVPQPDADGNERDGVRLPELIVPLATYAPWNLRDPSIGAPTQRVAFEASYLPFPKTAADRIRTGDPRLSIAERCKSRADYMERFTRAADELVKERWILKEDRAALIQRGEQEWDEATRP